MDTVTLTSTHAIDVLDPKIEDIKIADIATGLSNTCRWAGQTPRFYSVAEHSLRVAARLESPRDRLAALLHDAAEAYLLDVPRPLKPMLYFRVVRGHETTTMSYAAVESYLLGLILQKHDLAPTLPQAVIDADNEQCDIERLTVMRGTMAGLAPHVAREQWGRAYNSAMMQHRVAGWAGVAV